METKTSFYSDGLKIAAVMYEPEDAGDRACPGIVMCQGMVGIKEYFWFPDIGRRFAAMGYVALIWDYRGVGESEGEYGRLYPLEQAEDIRNALTYLELNPKVDPERLALIGWSFGAGMVPYVAGVDRRVKCAVSVAGWGDGDRWLKSLRRYYEWLGLLDRIDRDGKSRVLTGKSELMAPGEILVGDPSSAKERERLIGEIPGMEGFKSTAYSLATAAKLREFKPVDVVDRISPRAMLYIAAERDVVTPAESVVDMYKRTGEPKKLWVIPNIPHYGVYEEPYSSQVMEMATGWLSEHIRPRRKGP
jgi:pimeloyl-ACP methyl ester carboxylesterase